MSRAPMRWLQIGVIVLAAAVLIVPGAVAQSSGGATRRACPRPAVPVPPREPVYSAGPTELVSGLYVQGGPVPPPPCRPEPRGPYAGTITVTDPSTGRVVARQSVKDGHLARIKLAAGRYSVTGHFSGGTTTRAVSVRVKAGHKVRQDMFEDVP